MSKYPSYQRLGRDTSSLSRSEELSSYACHSDRCAASLELRALPNKDRAALHCPDVRLASTLRGVGASSRISPRQVATTARKAPDTGSQDWIPAATGVAGPFSTKTRVHASSGPHAILPARKSLVRHATDENSSYLFQSPRLHATARQASRQPTIFAQPGLHPEAEEHRLCSHPLHGRPSYWMDQGSRLRTHVQATSTDRARCREISLVKQESGLRRPVCRLAIEITSSVRIQ